MSDNTINTDYKMKTDCVGVISGEDIIVEPDDVAKTVYLPNEFKFYCGYNLPDTLNGLVNSCEDWAFVFDIECRFNRDIYYQLRENGVDIVAPVVRTTETEHGNDLFYRTNKDGRTPVTELKPNTLIEIDEISMKCVVLTKNILKDICPLEENMSNIEVCEKIRNNDYSIYVDTSRIVYTEQRYIQEMEKRQ